MAKVVGIGGVFFKSSDPKKLNDWYQKHLGLPGGAEGHVSFPWRRADEPDKAERTVWSIFPMSTNYFGPANPASMINDIVDDLDGMIESLRSSGTDLVDKREDHEYGKFAWVTDPDGNRFELWEPPSK